MHAEPISFSRSDYKSLTFNQYMQFFGFFKDSNYQKLTRNPETARRNGQIEILEIDLYIPYQFFRPKVSHR